MTSIQTATCVPESGCQKPTIVFDKSVFQRIAELSPERRADIWARVLNHYTLVIPSVLVEEILVNWGDPGATAPAIVEAMVLDLLQLRGYWLADEIDWAFQELVLNRRDERFIAAAPEFIERVGKFHPQSADYQKFLLERKSIGERELSTRLALQQEAAASLMEDSRFTDRHGRHFILVETEEAFFRTFVGSQFHLRNTKPELWAEVLNSFFGDGMRMRYPHAVAEIGAGLRSVQSQEQLFERRGTFNILISKSCYFWAPMAKIGKQPSSSKSILKRKEAAQKGNIHDERYVATAMLCSALCTRDREMARMASLFQRLGIWQGKIWDLPNGDIISQIDGILSTT
jgi:hypothetical protein